VLIRTYREDGRPFYNELSVSPVFGGRGARQPRGQKDGTERVRREE
jgi:hypothetical protein